MLPLKDCRGYRSRYINALNRAVRALTPIAGRGIRLRQSAQGVVIESTAKGGGGGTVVPAVEPLRFLKVEYREISVGSSGSQMRWCVYLGKAVPYQWLLPAGNADAPWKYTAKSGTIDAYEANDGWTVFATQEELNNTPVGTVVLLHLLFGPPSPNLFPSMSVVCGSDSDYNPKWIPDVYVLNIPFAVVAGVEGAHTLRQVRIGEVSLELVAANACNLLLKRQGDGSEWEEASTGTLVQTGDECAIAQWWAIRAHYHDTAHDELTSEISLRESMLAYAGTNCTSHADDHMGGLA